MHADSDSALREPIDDLIDVSMHQGVTAIEIGLSHPQIMKLPERLEHLVRRHLMRHGCMSVAIGTRQIATPCHLVREGNRIGTNTQPCDHPSKNHRSMHGIQSSRDFLPGERPEAVCTILYITLTRPCRYPSKLPSIRIRRRPDLSLTERNAPIRHRWRPAHQDTPCRDSSYHLGNYLFRTVKVLQNVKQHDGVIVSAQP